MTKSHFMTWLLSSSIPSIRYLALTRLLELPETDEEVSAAREAIMTSGPAPAIMAKQTHSGRWANEHSYYTPKYISSHWSMLLLTELAVDGSDPRFRQGVEFMLGDTQARLEMMIETIREEENPGWSCFWGNLLRYAVHGGYANDPRTEKIVHFLVRDLQDDSPCIYNSGLPCAWGSARTLWGLAALPPEHHTPEVKAAIQKALVFLLDKYSLEKGDYPTDGKPHAHWGRTNFPLFYQADILFVLRVLAELDALDHPGAQSALDWLVTQRYRNGRWRGTNPYNKRTWVMSADNEDIKRWVSVQAATVMKQARGEVF